VKKGRKEKGVREEENEGEEEGIVGEKRKKSRKKIKHILK
jgi:hypothetical protein